MRLDPYHILYELPFVTGLQYSQAIIISNGGTIAHSDKLRRLTEFTSNQIVPDLLYDE